MQKRKKNYLGIIKNEVDAARYYDHVVIQNQGNRVKTNFQYTKKQVLQILQ